MRRSRGGSVAGNSDEKVLAMPVDALYPFYSRIISYQGFPRCSWHRSPTFFEHYKDLEKGKWVKNLSWAGPDEARKVITEAIARYAR
jgi:inorganic pyrophosphatase